MMQLAGLYANPRQMSDAIKKGEMWESPGNLRVQARAIVLPIDEVSISFSASTFLPTRADIRTQHEGSPVAIALEFHQLPQWAEHAYAHDGSNSGRLHRSQRGVVRLRSARKSERSVVHSNLEREYQS